jgi:hypothetical protein
VIGEFPVRLPVGRRVLADECGAGEINWQSEAGDVNLTGTGGRKSAVSVDDAVMFCRLVLPSPGMIVLRAKLPQSQHFSRAKALSSRSQKSRGQKD